MNYPINLHHHGILWMLLFIPFIAFAQTHKIDSLSLDYAKADSDSAKLKALDNLIPAYWGIDLQKSMDYGEEAISIAKTMDDPKWEASALYDHAGTYFYLNDLNKCLEITEDALNIYKELEDTRGINNCRGNLANISYINGDLEQAISYYQQTVDGYIEQGNARGECKMYLSMVLLYEDLHNKTKAFEYAEKAFKLTQSFNDTLLLIEAHTKLGNLNEHSNDSLCFFHYHKSLVLAEAINDIHRIAIAKINLGFHYMEMKKDLDSAIPYFEEVIEMTKGSGIQHLALDAKQYLGLAYVEKGRFKEGIELIESSLPTEGNQSLERVAYAHQLLAKGYFHTENFKKAYQHLDASVVYKDSLYGEKNVIMVAELEAKYETQKKETEIAAQKLELESHRNTRNQIILGAILLFLLASGIYLWYYFRQNKKKQEAEIALEKQQLETSKLKEVDQLKSIFFANISHEFRTPLTLILGPIEEMISGSFKGNYMTYYKMIQRNGNRLLELINQLLDLSKLESRGMELKLAKGDIFQYSKSATHSFQSLADSKNIRFSVEIPEGELWTYFDEDKLEKIINNLLANAFKFTPENGMVMFSIKEKSDNLKISISDTGSGIPVTELPYIFNRFYQIKNPQNEVRGSGIGLALTKELIEFLHGKIEVHSEAEKGSQFIVTLPKTIIPEKNAISKATNSKKHKPNLTQITNSSNPIDWNNINKPVILVVEDNEDVRLFIKDKIRGDYQILEAKDGQEGIKVASEHIPDLIITDVMMPKMDGNEFCQFIKANKNTSHIPVIMLTAKAGVSNKIEGLEMGADDYLTKPFNGKELLVRMDNLIQQRKKLREKYSRGELKLNEIAVTSTDQRFLSQLMKTIEANLENEAYGIEDLAKEMNMSRRQLLRKTKALINTSPSILIRTIRLRRAKELLEKKAGNISEVAFSVGFSSLSYFTKCFKQEFGISPSDIT